MTKETKIVEKINGILAYEKNKSRIKGFIDKILYTSHYQEYEELIYLISLYLLYSYRDKNGYLHNTERVKRIKIVDIQMSKIPTDESRECIIAYVGNNEYTMSSRNFKKFCKSFCVKNCW